MCKDKSNEESPVRGNVRFNWDLVQVEGDNIGEKAYSHMINLQFSQKCDALLYTMNLTASERHEYEYLKTLGYFTPGFYMLHPLHYLGYEKNDMVYVKGGVLFICIWNEFLKSLDLEKILAGSSCRIDPETLELMPIVVFRNYRGEIFTKDCKTDLSVQYHCQNDTFEFKGVYKAAKNAEDSTYKLTKIFNRFYFDDSKLLKS